MTSQTDRQFGRPALAAGVASPKRRLAMGLARNVARLRYQWLGGVLLAIVVPAVLRWQLDGAWHEGYVNTLVGMTSAFTIGLLCYRRLITLPGVAASAYILPVFGLSFGLLLFAFYLGRVEYNRYLFPISAVLSMLWIYATHLAAGHVRVLRLAIVPGGSVDRLPSVHGAHWSQLPAPELGEVQCDGIVADVRADLGDDWERFIADCAVSGTPVFHVKQITESLTGRVEIEHLSENTLGALNPNDAYLKFKQIVDFLAAAVALVLLTPLLIFLAIAIRLDSPGPALFRQQRMGFRGRPFTVYKFRTMRHETGPGGLTTAITAVGDQRITRLGTVLRRSRLDELPQLINVVRGEMSLIGPRPEALELSEWYEAKLPFYRNRHIVRPGISGWAQVNQGHVAELDLVLEKLHYDFYYIKNFSLWLDVLILLRTIRTMLTGFGAR